MTPAKAHEGAFPLTGDETKNTEAGMTMRQHYAGLAMAGLLTSYYDRHKDDPETQAGGGPASIARIALVHADELLCLMDEEGAEEVSDVVAQMQALQSSNAELLGQVGRLREALMATRFAYIPDGHHAPHDCFATGPLTGDPVQDLIVCPGCKAEALARAALSATTQKPLSNEKPNG